MQSSDQKLSQTSRHNRDRYFGNSMWSGPKGLASRHGWVEIETYGKAKEEWLSTFLELPNGIPSHDTFGRIFRQLEPEILESNFQAWIKVIAEKLGLKVVAIDGKSLNGSYDRESSLKSLVMVSAWSSSHQLVLGQVAVEQKSNEIKAIPNSIRSHWGVENQLHWCLDVIFSEDDSRIRKDHAPQNMTILKRLALNLLRQDNSKGSLKMKRYQAGLNNSFLLQILSNSGMF